MKRKHVLSLLALALCGAASSAAFAQQNVGVIKFEGQLTNSGCTYAMSGSDVSYAVNNDLDGNGNPKNQGIGTVTMPSLETSQLQAGHAPLGAKSFTFNLTGCNVTAVNNSMWVNFGDGDPNVDANGRVKVTLANGDTTKLSLELLDSDGTTVIVAGQSAGAAPTPTQGTSVTFDGTNPAKDASKTYWVRYHANSNLAATDAGAFTASVTYNVYHY